MSTAECYPDRAPAANEVLDGLSHHLRREVIYYFEQSVETDTAQLDELVAQIGRRVPDEERRNLSLELHHHHLPKLETHGWLEFDSRTGSVRYRGHESAADLLRDVLEILAE